MDVSISHTAALLYTTIHPPEYCPTTIPLWLQANGMFSTANCRFEHPGANANPFGSNNNRFNALNTGGASSSPFGRAASTASDGTNNYKITKDTIKIDLVDERPQWILSSYGPGREAPEQLFGGYPREQSFEEIRLSVMSSPNPQQAVCGCHDWRVQRLGLLTDLYTVARCSKHVPGS